MWLPPAAISCQFVAAPTRVGVLRGVVSPRPSWPWELWPQHQSSPWVAVVAQVWLSPDSMAPQSVAEPTLVGIVVGTGGDAEAGGGVVPPAPELAASIRVVQVWRVPVVTAAQSDAVPTRVGVDRAMVDPSPSWLWELSPQHPELTEIAHSAHVAATGVDALESERGVAGSSGQESGREGAIAELTHGVVAPAPHCAGGLDGARRALGDGHRFPADVVAHPARPRAPCGRAAAELAVGTVAPAPEPSVALDAAGVREAGGDNGPSGEARGIHGDQDRRRPLLGVADAELTGIVATPNTTGRDRSPRWHTSDGSPRQPPAIAAPDRPSRARPTRSSFHRRVDRSR